MTGFDFDGHAELGRRAIDQATRAGAAWGDVRLALVEKEDLGVRNGRVSTLSRRSEAPERTLAIPPIYLSALGFSLFSGMAISGLGAIRAGQRHLLWHLPFMPLYWLILFPPLIQAIIEMRTRPFHWHKTAHGVTGAPL